MNDLSLEMWCLAFVAALFVGMAKTGIAGLGIVVVPLMASLFPAKQSTGVLLPLLVAADILAVAYYRRHARWSLLMSLLPAGMAGVVAGFFLMDTVDDAQLRLITGIVILALVTLTLARDRGWIAEERLPKGPALGVGMGFSVGVVTMLANAAGPIATIYFLLMKLPKREFIGTGAWYFLIINIWKLPFSYHLGFITTESLWFDAKLLPAILLGGVLGIAIIKRISQKHFVFWVQALAVAAAIKLLMG